ncbi:MAG TPA: hypothetical protein DEQ47_02370 [Solibacterales bacterium]|nr:hypothetical protein [Bryobacterales bacterium]
MRLACLVLLTLSCCLAHEIPAGTTLQVRLTDPISTASATAGTEVHAVTIAPVVVNGTVVIPQHTAILGKVISAVSAAQAENQQARLMLQFTGATVPLHALVANVDNAREPVNDKGEIEGIVPKQTFEGLADRGIEKLNKNQRYSQLGSILEAAKEALVKPVDPEISYEPGVEMTLRLTQAVNVANPPDYHSPPPFPKPGEIKAMVDQLPYITYAGDQPSDVTNLLFIGSEEQLTHAFAEAGWSTAQELGHASAFETARAMIEARGYKEAPVSLLLLDGRAPSLVFQKGNNTFAMRHHLRIWRMPGAFDAVPVWACSATHDSGIDLRQETFTFIHRIDSDIDQERAKVVDDLVFTGRVPRVSYVERPKVPRSFHNATGDPVTTDGRIAVVGLR